MNKEEDYRNLAGNITMFTDNTSFYEDWLVIQQYIDDWLDEIDNLQQENAELKKEINKISKKELKIMQMLRSIELCTLTKERIDQIEEVMFEMESNNER